MNLNEGWDAGPSDILGDIQRGIELMKKKVGYTGKVIVPKPLYNALSEAEKRNVNRIFDIKLVD